MGLTSTRRPWPFGAEIPAGNGVMLVPSQDGELLGKKAERFERVNPTEYDFSALPPLAETYFPFTRLIRGAGERTQSSKASKSYYYAIDGDASIGGYPAKGTLFHEQAPLATGEGRDGVAAFDGGVLKEFLAAGRYVLVRNGDGVADWAVSRDFGAGRQVQQMARFKNAGVTVVDALYVGLDNGEWWRYNGAAWTQGPIVEADLSAAYGYYFEVADDRLYRATGDSGNVVRSCSNDPFTMANWSGPITVGDAASPITWLRAFNKAITIFKTIGPFTLNADGTDNELMPEMRAQPAATNGRGAFVANDALWFRHADGYQRLTVQGAVSVVEPIGPERLLANDSETRGLTVCGASAGGFVYFGVHNPSNGNSYLWKLGTWLNPEETDSGKWEFVESYHGAVKKWAGRRITAMRVSNTAAGNDRLYCYFADGTVSWTKLPRGTPNHWASGSGCFPGDARVEAPAGVSRISRRWYEGELVRVTTAGGDQITGTPNHPVLTSEGWVPLGRLMEGDHVVGRARRQIASPVPLHPNDVEPSLEEVFRLAAQARAPQRVPTVERDFHGDGRDGYVDVVAVDGELRRRVEAPLTQPHDEDVLASSDLRERALLAGGAREEEPPRQRAPANTRVRGGDPRAPGIDVQVLVHEPPRVAVPARRHPGLPQEPDDRGSMTTAPTGDGLRGFTVQVTRNSVVHVDRQGFAGHVYNLQTDGGWYVANGIVVHNCEFTDQSAYFYGPDHHAMAQADDKAYRGFSAFGPVVDGSNYATVGYRTNPASAYATVGPFVTSSQRIDAADNTAGKALQYYLRLDSASSASTPVLEGVTIHHAIRPYLLLHYAATVDAQNNRARFDGMVDRKTAEQIRAAVKAAAATVGSVTVVLPDEGTRSVSVVNYVERELNRLQRWGLGWHLDVEMIEFRTYAIYGIWGRTRPYTWGDLRGMTWGQLRTL